MKILLPVIAAIALSGCAVFHPNAEPDTDAPPAYARVDVAGEIATPSERAACDAAGGEISREGLLGWEQCVQNYPDADQTCTDRDDCLGTCRHKGDAAPGSRVTGTCQVRDVPFGCFALVEKGVLQLALCVD